MSPKEAIPIRRALAAESTNDLWPRQDGFVTSMNVEKLGLAIIEIGGGRKRAQDSIDHSVGLEMLVRLGDPVRRSQPLANLFAPKDRRDPAMRLIDQAIEIGPAPPDELPLIAQRITNSRAAAVTPDGTDLPERNVGDQVSTAFHG